MLASSFLDTAIGIIFVFLLLSLIASTINEIVLSTLAAMPGRRSKRVKGLAAFERFNQRASPSLAVSWPSSGFVGALISEGTAEFVPSAQNSISVNLGPKVAEKKW
jgi:hypothetical protein